MAGPLIDSLFYEIIALVHVSQQLIDIMVINMVLVYHLGKSHLLCSLDGIFHSASPREILLPSKLLYSCDLSIIHQTMLLHIPTRHKNI